MKYKKYLALASLFLLLIGGILPSAKFNSDIISIFPVWNNFQLHHGLWQWSDISFFAVTLLLVILLIIYLLVTKKFKGLIIAGSLSLFVCLIIFVALLILSSKTAGVEDVRFSYSWGLPIVFAGGLASLFGGVDTKSKS
jgi:hypothetical protein